MRSLQRICGSGLKKRWRAFDEYGEDLRVVIYQRSAAPNLSSKSSIEVWILLMYRTLCIRFLNVSLHFNHSTYHISSLWVNVTTGK
jgi:hypothetical protein